MKCAACGYSDVVQEHIVTERFSIEGTGDKKPFIPLSVTFHEFRNEDGYHATGIKLYACPVCGTVKMEV